jgi:hypothetical protein
MRELPCSGAWVATAVFCIPKRPTKGVCVRASPILLCPAARVCFWRPQIDANTFASWGVEYVPSTAPFPHPPLPTHPLLHTREKTSIGIPTHAVGTAGRFQALQRRPRAHTGASCTPSIPRVRVRLCGVCPLVAFVWLPAGQDWWRCVRRTVSCRAACDPVCVHPCCTCACSYIKVDGCGNNDYYPTGYAAMGAALEASGRDIVYSCSWPAYIGSNETEKPFGAWRRGASGQVMVAPRQRAAGRLVGCVVAAVGAGVAARRCSWPCVGPLRRPLPWCRQAV